MTLSHAIRLHLAHLQARRRSSRTLAWYAEQFSAYRRWATAHDLPDFLPAPGTIDAFLAAEHTTCAPATVHARYRALRALFGFLERRRYLRHDDNPIHMIDPPSVPRLARRYVRLPDLQALLATCQADDWLDLRDRLLLLLLFYSGLRLSELTSLLVEHIDAAALTVLVLRGKGEKSRLVPVHPDVRLVLTAYLYSRPSHPDYLWLASDGAGGGRGRLTNEGVRQMLKRRCHRAGIPYVNPHAFRHGFAMWSLNSGMRLTSVSAILGHADPAITSAVYAHVTLDTVRTEYDELLRRSP